MTTKQMFPTGKAKLLRDIETSGGNKFNAGDICVVLRKNKQRGLRLRKGERGQYQEVDGVAIWAVVPIRE